jgi:hypothetical protein
MSLMMNRLLQSSSSNTNTNSDPQPDILEFLGFVAWYLFLVVCCIVPTACAYRRRRIQDNLRRNHMHHPNTQQQQAYFTNFAFSQRVPEGHERISLKEIQDVLEKTSMVSLL